MSARSLTDRKRRVFKRRHSPTKARRHDVYSLEEIQKLYGVEEQTVRNWVREGLKRVQGTSRFLVRGEHLNAFHAERNERAKRPLELKEFFCMGCQVPREPAPGSLVGAHPDKPELRLQGRCPICDTAMFRSWSKLATEAHLEGDATVPAEAEVTRDFRSGMPDTRRRLRPPATECDSVSPVSRSAPEKAPQTPESPTDINGSRQLALQFGFDPPREDDR